MKEIVHGKIVFECESCDAVLETDASPSEWTQAKACLDREGWDAHQVGSMWIHGCPKHAGIR